MRPRQPQPQRRGPTLTPPTHDATRRLAALQSDWLSVQSGCMTALAARGRVLEGPCQSPVLTYPLYRRDPQRREAPTEECRDPCARGITIRQYSPLGVPRGPLLPIAMY